MHIGTRVHDPHFFISICRMPSIFHVWLCSHIWSRDKGIPLTSYIDQRLGQGQLEWVGCILLCAMNIWGRFVKEVELVVFNSIHIITSRFYRKGTGYHFCPILLSAAPESFNSTDQIETTRTKRRTYTQLSFKE